ncbi:carboxysome shell carbonic anhydrase [Acidithiobacillus sp. AMEEHan]|uniref:carboxysome shell carbonic anhydrase n=1 Tax=Acidithiobacillus sp. AMEEHan TaxID=2994951 RepID=UPI0027E4949A|nr:carboxysome shell carbonic anhydrase [Acidithiobacillus sp. AMEEHan]
MDTRKSFALRQARSHGYRAPAPIGMGVGRPAPTVFASGALHALARGHEHPACITLPERNCSHALADLEENARLAEFEAAIKGGFDAIVPALQEIAALGLGEDFARRAQEIAQRRLGFQFSQAVLERAWVNGPEMGLLFGEATFAALESAIARFSQQIRAEMAAGQSLDSFLVDCGFHAVSISTCSDGRLKGLFPFILRLPSSALVRRDAFAGVLFDIEEDVRHWESAELRRFREGYPTMADANTRYLKVAVYHGSSVDPSHEGCAAHGSNINTAIEAALERLYQFRLAIENAFCCGASTDLLLIGVDTDTDAIRIHIPDANGDLSPHRYVDNAELYKQTLGLDRDQATLAVYEAIRAASNSDGWGRGEGMPHDGMRRLIATLLINNMSQIEYVGQYHGGWYQDGGHAERFIGVGNGFQEVQIRNLAYYAHVDTVEEGAQHLDIGIKIFKKLNVSRHLPIPMVLRYRYDSRVPGSRDRVVERVRRVAAAIEARYANLLDQGLLILRARVQDRPLGSAIEEVDLG